MKLPGEMIDSLRRTVAPYYKNIRGWRTNRKIVVFESDDWGSIRMPSRDVYNKYLRAGYRVDQIAYEKYDSLASEEDLELLFDLLISYKDKDGNHPIITANALVANPDFDKIEQSGFQEYHYELITDTFNRYSEHANSFTIWQQGLEAGVFFPQSHGREHLNVSMFMNALQHQDPDILFGFKNRVPGSMSYDMPSDGNKFVEALKFNSFKDKELKLSIVLEGLELFEKLFGYKSKSFTPPNYYWSPDFDEALHNMGVKYFQGLRSMSEPKINGKGRTYTYTLGEKNMFNQRYLIRNCSFEPSLSKSNRETTVEDCLSSISAAFSLKKPAVICSHRLNFVGYLDKTNREKNLLLLKILLDSIVNKWPEVEFMNSVSLGDLIESTDR